MITRKNEPGFIAASLIITMTFLFIIVAFIFQLISNNLILAKGESYRINAQFAADAGVDMAISELNLDRDWAGYASEQEHFNNTDMKTTFEVTVSDSSDPDSTDKIVNVTGYTYVPASASEPRTERSYEVEVRGLGLIQSDFSIVAGVGGLVLDNQAKIVGGAVYVNGSIQMSSSSQIGTTTNPVPVFAAHNNCPIGGGGAYPELCTLAHGSGLEPISISNSATIYGPVCGNNQVTDYGIDDTIGDNGLYEVGVDFAVCGVPDPLPALPLPVHDRTAQKAAITITCSLSSCPSPGYSYYTDCNSNSAQRTWPHGLKIVGDVDIMKKCEITIEGDVWITGKLTVINSADIRVSDSLDGGPSAPTLVDAAGHPTIMVDDEDGIEFLNGSRVSSNSSGFGAQFITYWSVAGCSPDCSDVTGVDLLNSSDQTTIYLEQSAEAASSILYARWSQVDLNNGGDIGALVGQTILLRNSSAVTFSTEVSGDTGDFIPVWLVRNYRRTFE